MTGDQIVMNFHQYRIRREVKRQINRNRHKDELHLVSVHIDAVSGLDWKKEDEFRYKGSMYDVVSSDTIQDSIFFYCELDTKETQLISRFDGHLLRKHRNKYLNNRKLKQIVLVSSANSIAQIYDLSSVYESDSVEFYSNYRHSYKSPDANVIYPPPKWNLCLAS